MYLSSRDANTFPDLNEIEAIVDRLESIQLPEGDDWKTHYIRPRAVYFDNKHDQFIVFADYLYPEDRKDAVLTPRDVNLILRDGEGLHKDRGAEWYITSWDIRYVSTSQASDHFHLDHKDYYTPFLNQYRAGIGRARHGSFLRDISRWPTDLIIT
jgi:hypothetical protein